MTPFSSTSPAPETPGAVRPGSAESDALLDGSGLKPVSPRLIPARYLGRSPLWAIELVLVIGLIVLAVIQGWFWPVPIALLILVLLASGVILVPRRVRAIGYLDGEEHVVTASGIMFRSVTLTPYGRIQSVEIEEGPIERRYGLASITFSTAASDAGGAIPGLPKAEAERLRELLTRRGIDRMQSL